MGRLVAVEGLDGSGKRTLVGRVIADLEADRRSVTTLAFPRYGASIHADLAAEALRGEHGDLAGSPEAMALLFALDRAGAAADLRSALATHDLVLLDRYVASNAAYGAARTHQHADGAFATLIGALEFDRLRVPVPDLQILLDVPVALAAERARRRGEADAGRALDAYERDADLQHRTATVYRELAARAWHGEWWVVTPQDDPALLGKRMAQWLQKNRMGHA